MNFLPEIWKSRKSVAPTNSHRRGFTLIELLVVIAIIAILAGLLFPAAQQALNSAKKTTAKNQVIQIATAITGYEAEYGCLPITTPPPCVTNVGATLVGQLTTNNSRSLSFIDTSPWKQGKGGTNATGFCDPWGSVYQVALDTGYSNQITSLALGGNLGSTNLTKHIAVWTIFTNRSTQTLIDSWD